MNHFLLTGKIISCCIEVHKNMGPGLLEKVYENCLMKEFQLRGIKAEAQVEVPLRYKGFELEKTFAIDILVEKEIVLELKAVEHILPVFEAQLISYLKLTEKKIGFLINFNVPLMKHGIKRFSNNYEHKSSAPLRQNTIT
jgi:GxxExxY protein